MCCTCCRMPCLVCDSVCRAACSVISELSRTPLTSLYASPQFLRQRNVIRTWVHICVAAVLLQWVSLTVLFSVQMDVISHNFISDHPPLFSVAEELARVWPRTLQVSYNGSILSAKLGEAETSKSGESSSLPSSSHPSSSSKLIRDVGDVPIPITIELGSRSGDVLNLFTMLQQEQSSARWAYISYSELIDSRSKGVLQFVSTHHNISVVLGLRDVRYISRGRSITLPYDRTDHPVHIFVNAMCNSQIVRSGGAQAKSKDPTAPIPLKPKHRYTFMCTKSMLREQFRRMGKKNKRNQRQQSNSKSPKHTSTWERDLTHIESMLKRSLKGEISRAEEVAALITTRTMILGILSNIIELCTLANAIAMVVFILLRSACRRPGTDLIGLLQMHHLAIYTCTPTLFLTKLGLVLSEHAKHVLAFTASIDLALVDDSAVGFFVEDGAMLYALCVVQCMLFTLYVTQLVGQNAEQHANSGLETNNPGAVVAWPRAPAMMDNSDQVLVEPMAQDQARDIAVQALTPPVSPQAAASRATATQPQSVVPPMPASFSAVRPPFRDLQQSPLSSPSPTRFLPPSRTPISNPMTMRVSPCGICNEFPGPLMAHGSDAMTMLPVHLLSPNLIMMSGGLQGSTHLWQQQFYICSIQAQITQLRLARARIAAVMAGHDAETDTFSEPGTPTQSARSLPHVVRQSGIGGASEYAGSLNHALESGTGLDRTMTVSQVEGESTEAPIQTNSSMVVVELGMKLAKLKDIRSRLGDILGADFQSPHSMFQHPDIEVAGMASPSSRLWENASFRSQLTAPVPQLPFSSGLISSAVPCSSPPDHGTSNYSNSNVQSLTPGRRQIPAATSPKVSLLSKSSTSSMLSSSSSSSPATVPVHNKAAAVPQRAPTPTVLTSSAPSVSPYRVGVRVRSRWQNIRGQFYNATVSAVNEDGTFEIDYEDGDHDSNVEASRLSLEPWVPSRSCGIHHSDSDVSSSGGDSDVEGDTGSSMYVMPRMSDSELDRMNHLLSLSPSSKMHIQEEQFNNWVQSRLEECVLQDIACDSVTSAAEASTPVLMTATHEVETTASAVVTAVSAEGSTVSTMGISVSAAGAVASAGETNHVIEEDIPTGADAGVVFAAAEASAVAANLNSLADVPVVTPTIARLSSESGAPLLRAASQDPVLRDMKFTGGRPFLNSPEARASSFNDHKARFLAYALERYNELERYRKEDPNGVHNRP